MGVSGQCRAPQTELQESCYLRLKAPTIAVTPNRIRGLQGKWPKVRIPLNSCRESKISYVILGVNIRFDHASRVFSASLRYAYRSRKHSYCLPIQLVVCFY
jgi:hypothetical protein